MRLPRAGSYTVRASRRGLGAGTATVRAGNAGSESRPAAAPQPKPLSFSGTCQFTGTVFFQPAMTNSPQDINQHISAPGTCSGTLVDHAGQSHQLSNAPATFTEKSLATSSTCLDGTATGDGALIFDYGQLHVGFSETRLVAFPLLTLTGAASGSAQGQAEPSQSEDPAADVQACNGSGLKQFTIDGRLATTGISG